MNSPIATWRRLLPFAAAALVACNDPEAPAEDHTPTTVRVLIDGVEATQPYTFTQGATVRVQLKFFNAANEDLDEVEGSHFAGLTFDPAGLATAVRVSDHHFQFDVTGGTPGAGTVSIGYGHDDAADEHSFPDLPVVVQAAASPAR
jgi:hypothetical protein